MSCIAEGMLRAYLDDELADDAREVVSRHLATCPGCRDHLARLERSASSARHCLSTLSPAQEPDARSALARFHRYPSLRARGHKQPFLRRSAMSRANRGRAWRPALAGGIILALLVGVFSFAPSRAWARQLLGIFRVNKFAVVSVAPDQARIEAAGQALQDKLFVGEPEMIADEPTVQVKSVAEASQKAGFTVRVPKALSAKPQISVKGRSEASFTFSREGLVTLLNLAGMDPAAIPNNFNTAKLHVTVPAMANVEIGDYRITQVRAPEIDYPEGIDPQVIGQAGLRIMGVSPQEAERITGKLDWTNTLLLPIPKDAAEYREVIVAGEQGVILIPRPQAVKQAAKVAAEAPSTSIRQSDVDKVESVSSESTLVFEMDGIIYVVSANTSPESLVRIAESLF